MVDTTNADEIAEMAWRGLIPDDFRDSNPLFFHVTEPKEVRPGIWFFMTFANVTAILTTQGWVLVDCGFIHMGEDIYNKVQVIKKAPIHTIIITHGHVDHCGGGRTIETLNMQDYNCSIRFVGHKNIGHRFARYVQTSEFNRILNHKQFGTEFDINYQDLRHMDLVYDDKMLLNIGEVQLQLFHDKGETDDATWIYMPQEKVLLTGDFIIWNLCNCSNPQKSPRYPESWAQTMRKMAKLDVELLLPGHGPYISTANRIKQVLNDTALVLEIIINQTVALINEGLPRHEIVKRIQMPGYLLRKPYLKPFYADPEFIIQEVCRHKAGWWSGKLYELKEMDMTKLSNDIISLFPDIDAYVLFINKHYDSGNMDLALFYVEIGRYAIPDNVQILHMAERIYTHFSDFKITPASMIRNQFNFNLRKVQLQLASKL